MNSPSKKHLAASSRLRAKKEDSARGRRKWGSQGGESGRGGVCTLLGSVLKLARLACVVRD